MLDLVKVDYQGQETFFDEHGWMNATRKAEQLGRRLDHWLRTEETQAYIEALARRLNTPKKGDLIRSKRGKNGGTWLHPKLAVAFARWLSPDFAVWCDLLIDSLIREDHPHFDWKRSRHAAIGSNRTLNLAIQMARERLGKTCAPHHFSNEARLINWVMTGTFGKLDRDNLGIGDLDLLSKLEVLNTVLLANNMPYRERKIELERYAAEQREPRLILLN